MFRGTAVEGCVALYVEEVPLRHREPVEVVPVERGVRDAGGETIEVDFGGCLRLRLVLLIGLRIRGLVILLVVLLVVLGLDLVRQRSERAEDVFAEG